MNLKIYEEASEWLVKHRSDGLDAREKAAFDAWLRQSPQHIHAYLEMSSVWEEVPSLAPEWNASADELIARARADSNVVPLSVATPPALNSEATESEPTLEATGRGRLAQFLAVAASVVMVVAGGWMYSQRGVYSTDVGEQRSLLLTDGSTVELNSRSKIRVRYSDEERLVELLQGQALFHVAKNKLRPFVVQSSTTRVRAVGTSFDVYKASAGTVVTVVEGRVAVGAREAKTATAQGVTAHAPPAAGAASASTSPLTAGVGEVFLAAGEQVVVKPKEVAEPRKADVSAATAWTRRSLVFDSSPLTEVADEFNRYNTRRLIVEDAQLVEFRVSGVFSSAEPTLLLRFLRAQPELVVDETDADIRIRRR